MKLFVVFAFFFACAIHCMAQKELYDLLLYTPPKDWKKETGNSQIVYSHVSNVKNAWCQILVFKSTNSKGNIAADFDSEWDVLVAKSNTITSGPVKETMKEEKGWKFISAGAKGSFNGNEMMILMKTWSDEQVCVSVVARTNDAGYLQQIEDFDAGIELNRAPAKTITASENNTDVSITGSWGKGAGVNTKYAAANSYAVTGYTKDQYHFNKDGTYKFYSKTFGSAISQLILVREHGKYTINGNSITVIPSQSILESYTKKNGVDEWGKLVSTQKRALEKVTYRFTKHYFSGIQQWNLVLMADKPTDRDGPFSNNKSFENAWYFAAFSSNNPEIVLPGGGKASDAALNETKRNTARKNSK